MKKQLHHIYTYIETHPVFKRSKAYVRMQAKKMTLEQFLFVAALIFTLFFIIGLYS